jgi:hypothetical protein
MEMARKMAGGKEGNGDGNNGVGQGTAMARTRAMAAATRVAGDKKGKGSEGSKGQDYCDEGGGQ